MILIICWRGGSYVIDFIVMIVELMTVLLTFSSWISYYFFVVVGRSLFCVLG